MRFRGEDAGEFKESFTGELRPGLAGTVPPLIDRLAGHAERSWLNGLAVHAPVSVQLLASSTERAATTNAGLHCNNEYRTSTWSPAVKVSLGKLNTQVLAAELNVIVQLPSC